MDETPPSATSEFYEAQSSAVLIAIRRVSYTLSLPVQYRPTHIPGWSEEFKSEEGGKSGTEKCTNRANGIIKHPRTRLLHCAGVTTCMKTGRLPFQTKVFARTNKKNLLTELGSLPLVRNHCNMQEQSFPGNLTAIIRNLLSLSEENLSQIW